MIIESCKKAIDNEFTLSCMVILGLGGKTYTDAHILDTAKVVSQISPHFLALSTSTLTKMFMVSSYPSLRSHFPG